MILLFFTRSKLNYRSRIVASSSLENVFEEAGLQYCAKVMQTNFVEIPGFSWLFEEISLETIFRRNFPAFS